MANINNFEELKSWQKSRELCAYVFKLTNKENFKREFSLKDQIIRSSGSVMDNIAEGFDRMSPKEFRRFLFYSKGSCSEVKSQLYRAFDQNFITKEEFNKCFKLAVESNNLIGGFINYLEKCDKQKTK